MSKNISYLNKDFDDFKSSLVSFAKWYFPNTYTNFSDASPETMFLGMGAYVGDVLGFYLDNQIQENLLLQAQEKDNIYQSAYTHGYRPQVSYASTVDVDVYQLVASLGGVPNYSHAVTIGEYTKLTSTAGVNFLTIEEIRFDEASNPEVIYNDNSSYYLKQTIKAISAQVKTETFNFTDPVKFDSATIFDSNILGIIKVVDSNSAVWYEVSYLAESKIIIRATNPNYSVDGIPYLLRYQNVPKRFTTRFIDESNLTVYFGAGVSNLSDTTILPNMDNLSLGNLTVPSSYFQGNYAKAKSLFTKEYGLTPQNLSLTFSYIVGGGLAANIGANTISTIDTSNVSFNVNDTYKSITVINTNPASGGRGGDTLDEIKLNSLNSFQAQNRSVTKEDYTLRVFSMPTDFGKVSKALVLQDIKIATNQIQNPLALSLYVLSEDENGKLITASDALKENIKSYLQEYRMATDAINIKNAFVVNIGVNFDITTNPGYNNSEVLTNCILQLQDYFLTDKWQINQPIVLSEVYGLLLQIKGVQSVPNVTIVNKAGGLYSPYGYDIAGATRKNIIYPSVDPCIFSVYDLNSDISGRIIVP